MGKRIVKYRLELVKESSKIYDLPDLAISSPGVASRYINEIFRLDRQSEEVFVQLVLDTKNKIVGAFEVSRGTLNASLVHPRDVFKRSILSNGASILLAHNHPSGSPVPSKEDITITKRLKEAGEIIGIDVLDHIIIGDGYSSMKEDGVI